jgi:hypothetical protein
MASPPMTISEAFGAAFSKMGEDPFRDYKESTFKSGEMMDSFVSHASGMVWSTRFVYWIDTTTRSIMCVPVHPYQTNQATSSMFVAPVTAFTYTPTLHAPVV